MAKNKTLVLMRFFLQRKKKKNKRAGMRSFFLIANVVNKYPLIRMTSISSSIIQDTVYLASMYDTVW
jgi:hypothetical protein